MYDENESLYVERMMSEKEFGALIVYIAKFSQPISRKRLLS